MSYEPGSQMESLSVEQLHGLVENAKVQALKTSSWIDAFKTDIELIDQEHQMLFQLIAAVKVMKNSPKKSSKAIKMVLEELNDYTITHFRDEEQIFDEEQWPGSEKHKIFHKFFCQKIQDAIEDFSSKGVSVLNDEFLDFLNQWFATHVTKDDREHTNWTLGRRQIRGEKSCCAIM